MMRYDVLHDYAQRNKLDYNELCRVMREATATPLTDDQIDTIYVSKLAGKGFDNIAVAFRAMVRAVEKAHGIGGANVDASSDWTDDAACLSGLADRLDEESAAEGERGNDSAACAWSCRAYELRQIVSRMVRTHGVTEVQRGK